MEIIKINNWEKYQSYKDRRPPWIRFHKTMLDNYDFQTMTADARALLPMLWLLASEDENPVSGLIRDGYEKVIFRLRMDKNTFISALKEIEKNEFISLSQDIENIDCNESVTNPLQNRNETVTPETETETETETEKAKLFEAFWINWNPYEMDRGNKKSALKKYLSVLKKIKSEVLENKAKEYCSHCERMKCKTKHVVTWLNQNGWEDSYSSIVRKEFTNYTELSAREQAERLIM